MTKETISRTTFSKGIAAGLILAASLGILTIGDYTAGGSSADSNPAARPPETASAAAIAGASADETENETALDGAAAGESGSETVTPAETDTADHQ